MKCATLRLRDSARLAILGRAGGHHDGHERHEGVQSRAWNWTGRPQCRAFTMIEIALSLAVVAFALVAILGVLPAGLQVQKDNREETIVNADGTYILEAIRTGNDRLGLLSNSVYLVTINYLDGSRVVIPNDPPILDGQRLVGLLSTPALPIVDRNSDIKIVSNVVAWVRAVNRPAIDTDPDVRDMAFRYQMVSEIRPHLAYPPALTNRLATNDLHRIQRLQETVYDVRLNMRWPLYSDSVSAPQNARVGTRRRTFRSLLSGTFQPGRTNFVGGDQYVFYFRPSVYGP